jgi:preprotein translocase subunit SecD
VKRLVSILVVTTALVGVLSGCSSVLNRLANGGPPTNCVEITYRLVPDPAGTAVDAATLDVVRAIVSNRLSTWPVTDPSVEAQAPDKLVVRLPRPGLTRDIQALIGERGQIAAVPIPAEFADQVVEGQPLPVGMSATPIFTSDGIASATQESDGIGTPTVNLVLTADAAKAFDDFSGQAFGGSATPKVALVVDDTVILALTLQSDHYDGQIQISSKLNGDDATRLVAMANDGPLPVELEVVSSLIRSCSPTG